MAVAEVCGRQRVPSAAQSGIVVDLDGQDAVVSLLYLYAQHEVAHAKRNSLFERRE